jgi:hypothetical protein
VLHDVEKIDIPESHRRGHEIIDMTIPAATRGGAQVAPNAGARHLAGAHVGDDAAVTAPAALVPVALSCTSSPEPA